MAKSTAQERSPGLGSRKGPPPPRSPDPYHDGNVTSDDDATVISPEDSPLAVDSVLGSKTPHRPRSAQSHTRPTANGITPTKAHPPNYPPPPPDRPTKTPPLASPNNPAEPPPDNSQSPPPPPVPHKTPSPPPSGLNEASPPASQPPAPKAPSSPPQPRVSPPAPPARTPPLSVVGPKTPSPSTASLGFVPPPPPPASSPPLSGHGPIRDDESVIHSPVPRTPAKPFGRLRNEMESYRKSHRGGDSSEEDETVSIIFPHTYPAHSREESRTRAKTDADATRVITTTMAHLQGRSSQEAVTGKIGNRNVRDLWGELSKKRADIYELRLGMVDDRKALRELRRRKNVADNKMLSMVRQVLPRIGNESRRSFADAQALRDEYTTQENLYEAHEVALDGLEAELELLETKFFAGLSRRARADEDTEAASPEPSDHDDVPLDLRGISADGPPEDIHPLYSQFQDSVGDFGLASESWHELLGARSEIEFKLTIDKHLEMERLDEEELEFLSEYSEEEVRRSNELQEARWRVEHLRKLCVEWGVMRKHLPFQMVYVLHKYFPTEDDDKNDLGEDMDLTDNTPSKLVEGGRERARPFLWRLMSQEAHLLGDFPILPPEALDAANDLPSDDPQKLQKVHDAEEELFLYEIFSNCPAHDISEFVNRWLLHQLRISPHMALLWYNAATDEDRDDPLKWQEYVLGEWWSDDALPIKGPEGSTRARDGENESDGEKELPVSSTEGDRAIKTSLGVEVAAWHGDSPLAFSSSVSSGRVFEIPVSIA